MPRSAPVRLADLARYRQVAYRLFGSVLLYPDEERFAMLIAAARELEFQSQPFVGLAFFPQWRRFLEVLARRSDSGTADLEETYLGLFVMNQDVPVCESGFLAPGSPALTMAALDEEYNAGGLSMAASFSEPPDHAAVELEFMSLLCEQEGEAWAKRSVTDAVRHLESEAGFLDRHLSRWFPVFTEQVGNRAGDSFYTSVTKAAHSFIEHDRALLNAFLEQYRQEALHG
jgi:TorA maturation chaperone TorD